MKKFLFISVIALAAAILAMPAIPGMRRGNLSATRSFSIDGNRFLLDSSVRDDLVGIREELRRLRVDIPDLGNARGMNSFYAAGIRIAGKETAGPTPKIPNGMRAEHVVKTNSDSASVELAVGSLENPGAGTLRRLTDSGWECIVPVPGKTAVSIKNQGKETTIVLLEEKEGKFLLIRRLE